MSIMFNEIFINEEMVPIYIYIISNVKCKFSGNLSFINSQAVKKIKYIKNNFRVKIWSNSVRVSKYIWEFESKKEIENKMNENNEERDRQTDREYACNEKLKSCR